MIMLNVKPGFFFHKNLCFDVLISDFQIRHRREININDSCYSDVFRNCEMFYIKLNT